MLRVLHLAVDQRDEDECLDDAKARGFVVHDGRDLFGRSVFDRTFVMESASCGSKETLLVLVERPIGGRNDACRAERDMNLGRGQAEHGAMISRLVRFAA
jgi:hypothetical protein